MNAEEKAAYKRASAECFAQGALLAELSDVFASQLSDDPFSRELAHAVNEWSSLSWQTAQAQRKLSQMLAQSADRALKLMRARSRPPDKK